MASVRACHMVGSVPLPDSEAVFRQCTHGMPGRLKRIPDGETGSRNMFTSFQAALFHASPMLVTEFINNAPIQHNDYTSEQIDEGIAKLEAAGPLQTGYDDAAIESMSVLRKLRDEGAVPKDVRLQVCLPTPANVLTPFVEFAFQSRVEPIYEEALFRALKKIQDTIPHEDLAIQIDLAVDTAFWEGVEMYKPWFGGDVKTYVIDYIVRMLGQIDLDVEVGIHNCYGDMEHRHWKEPTSLAVIVERALRIMDRTPHPIDFFHCPVPLSALDKLDTYLAPLADLVPRLKENRTELYLGVVHYDDMPATERMIEAARRVLGDYDFGVATECGWGRTPPEQLAGIMKISTDVSEAVL